MNTTLRSVWLPTLALVTLLATLAPTAALADTKPLGVIDSDRIAKEYPAARDAQERYEQFIRELQREVEEKERELQMRADELESQKLLLGETALADKQEEFANLRDEYFQYRETADSRVEDEYKATIQPIIDQVRTIAERIGREEGYGLVIDATALTILFIDSSVDLTDKVLSALVRGEE